MPYRWSRLSPQSMSLGWAFPNTRIVSSSFRGPLEITRRVIPRVSGSSLIHVPTKPPEAPGAIEGAIIRFTDSCWAWQVTATGNSEMASPKTAIILRTFKLSAPFISSSCVFIPHVGQKYSAVVICPLSACSVKDSSSMSSLFQRP